MQTSNSTSPSLATVQQISKNTTSWIGHRTGDSKTYIGGQTLISPAQGKLDMIEVFFSHISNDGRVEMTIHSFDPSNKTWGPIQGNSSVSLVKADSGKWIAFQLNSLKMEKGKTYGFQLHCKDTLIGVGEAAGSFDQPPYSGGQEWAATTENQSGNFYSYLSLAFKMELRA